ncbi:MAG: ATP-binding protein [Candidatus Thermoplasmatota archaeon]
MTFEFVDREEELNFLEEKYSSDDFELVLIYGRRRIGKTELIKNFIEGKPSIYCLASLEDKEKQLENIAEKIYKHFKGIKPDVRRWTDLFEYFSEKAEEKTVLVIDEFPYLIEENESIPSYFQKFVDEYLKDKDVMLILCGSYISMMEDLMSYENPLYGRRSGQIDLKSFPFKEARKMIPTTDFEDSIRYYSVFGGVPFYLQKLEGPTLKKDIKEKVCRNTEILYEEPQILLRQEFRKPNRYFSIMESIASGKTTPKAISDDTKIPLQSISKYLRELQRIRLVRHEVPVTAREKNSRRGLYRIKDNFFDFWFQFIGPHLSDLEERHDQFVEDHVMAELDRYVGKKFEKVCREFLREKSKQDEGFMFPKIGRWWYKEDEIDIVGLNERENKILLAECKWSKNKVGLELFYDLKQKSEKVRWNSRKREEDYILFSKSGFERKVHQLDEEVKLFNLEDMKKVFY